MSVAQEIRDRLQAAFAPDRLDVVDDSESHRGHAGWREGGETEHPDLELCAGGGMIRRDIAHADGLPNATE
jgi:BolA protein